jgi:hypothetical protein
MPYRGGKRPSRAVQRTRRRRPVGGHTPVGLATAGGLAEAIAAGVLGTAATWVASTGSSRAAGREAQIPRSPRTLGRGLQGAGPWFLGGALRAWPVVKAPPKKPSTSWVVFSASQRLHLELAEAVRLGAGHMRLRVPRCPTYPHLCTRPLRSRPQPTTSFFLTAAVASGNGSSSAGEAAAVAAAG